MKDAYGMSMVSSAFMATRSSSERSIVDVTGHPGEMLKRLATMLMKDGWEMCIVPSY